MVGTNCYVVYNENTKECFVVDPAAPSAPRVEYIQTEGLQLQGILLTHGHFDHIMGIDTLMIEVHNDPECALCDGAQSLKPEKYAALLAQIGQIAQVVGKQV